MFGNEECDYPTREQPRQELVEAAPFGALVNARSVKLYVSFLAAKPKRMPGFPLRVEKEALDVRGLYTQDALIVSYRKSNGFYGFPGGWTEQELGVVSTARNWSTVLRIAKRPT